MLTYSHKGQALAYSSLIKKCPDFRLCGEVQEARLVQKVCQEREYGFIGPKDFTNQHKPEYGHIRLSTMRAGWLHASTPLCRTPLTGMVVTVRSQVLRREFGSGRIGSGLRMHYT